MKSKKRKMYFGIRGISLRDAYAKLIYKFNNSCDGYRWELNFLYVDEGLQGRGYSKKLLDKAIAWARKNKIPEIWFVDVNKSFWRHIRKTYPHIKKKSFMGDTSYFGIIYL